MGSGMSLPPPTALRLGGREDRGSHLELRCDSISRRGKSCPQSPSQAGTMMMCLDTQVTLLKSKVLSWERGFIFENLFLFFPLGLSYQGSGFRPTESSVAGREGGLTSIQDQEEKALMTFLAG